MYAAMSDYPDIYFSQGSEGMYLRYGGIFDDYFIARLLLSQTVKELWKSANFWQSYGQE